MHSCHVKKLYTPVKNLDIASILPNPEMFLPASDFRYVTCRKIGKECQLRWRDESGDYGRTV